MPSIINASTASGGGIIASGDSSGILQLQTGGTTAVTVDASQNVGVGTASPAYKLDIQNAGNFSAQLKATAGNYAQWSVVGNAGTTNFGTDNVGGYVQTVGAIPLLFYTSNTERARFDTSGNLLVGTTSNQNGVIGVVGKSSTVVAISAGVTNNGDNAVTWRNASGSAVAGVTVNSGTIVYGTVSDYRLKENTLPMVGALKKVALLKPCTYTWKKTGEAGQGFLAHELQEVIPDAVAGVKDAVYEDGSERYQSVDTSFVVATLTAAIQEQQALITTLTERITALEAK